jgi:hypothetical protein
MFDDLLLLKKGGETVFCGELGEESCNLVNYLESQNARPINHGENPAAWMLRAYTGENEVYDWKGRFEASELHRSLKQIISSIKESRDERKKITYDCEFATSSSTRTWLMTRRIMRVMLRSPSYNLVRLMIALLYAFILGCVFIRTLTPLVFDESTVNGLLGTMFLSQIVMGVVSISMSVPVMKEIRDVFYKHRASGMIGHSAVCFAVTLGEVPFMLLISIFFTVVYYAVTGLFLTPVKWFGFFGFYVLNIANYVYFGQAFICLVKDIPTAGALVGALIGYNVFFSGFIVKPQYFAGPFQLGYWTAPGRFAFEGMVVTQFSELDYEVQANYLSPFYFALNCTLNTTKIDCYNLDGCCGCCGSIDEYVNFYFGGRFIPGHKWLCVGILTFCLLLARLLLFVSLGNLNYVNT